MSTATQPLTAEEYARLPETDVPTELVRGEVIELNQPYPHHGLVCGNVFFHIRSFADAHDLGRTLCNDAGVITERDPDTVRGPDVWFISYQKVPKGSFPTGRYLDVVPDIAFEVKSDFDRWNKLRAKVTEYLEAGVPVVCVLDPEDGTIRLYYYDKPEIVLAGDDPVTFPEQLPGFSMPARRFFE